MSVKPKKDGLVIPLDFTDWRVVGRLFSMVSTETWISVYGPESPFPEHVVCTIGDEDRGRQVRAVAASPLLKESL